MPVPHLNIRIVQRSKGNSAVAGAAYQAGEKLFSEYDQKHKDHRRKQHEVVYTEITQLHVVFDHLKAQKVVFLRDFQY